MKKLNIFQKLFALYFVFLVLGWAYLYITHSKDGLDNYTYSFAFGLVPLIGGIIGMVRAKMWGGLKSALGKAVFFISLGLFWWGFGETIWSYYNFFKDVAAPYPSIADIGFAQSIFFWIIGTFFLAKASGAWFALRKSSTAKLVTVLVTVGLTALSYYMLVKVARGGVLVPEGESPLKLVLDIAYPLGDFLALILASTVFILSFKYFGGYYRLSIVSILLGLATMYFGDFVFSYTTTTGTFYNASPGDLILTTGLFLMTFGVLGFATRPVIKRKQESEQVVA
jgi:hypothetical protein